MTHPSYEQRFFVQILVPCVMTSLGKANWCPRVRQWVAAALFSYYVAGLGAERPLGAGDATNYATLCRHTHRYCVETSGCPGGERSQFSQSTFRMKMAWCRRRGVRVCIPILKQPRKRISRRYRVSYHGQRCRLWAGLWSSVLCAEQHQPYRCRIAGACWGAGGL